MAEKKARVRTKKPIVKKVTTEPVEAKEEPKNYMECPFCHSMQYERIGRDETSSWCSVCGRCFPAIWKF